MSDRRAVTAGRLEAPSVAGQMWRVAVGGNRVENMTVEEIAQAYHSGHLSVRTPLWPPGTSGWQALGNFEQFQYAPSPQDMMSGAPYQGGQYQQLSQFQEGDDDPTRMWTGAPDLEMPMPAPMPVAPVPSAPPPARPSARTGPRLASQAPRPVTAPPAARAQRPVSSAPTATPSVPPFRTRRSSGWLLVAGLVGLVGLGSAVLAARGNWSSAAMDKLVSSGSEPATRADTAAAPSSAAPAAAPEAAAAAAPAAPSAAGEAPTVNGVAKYEESGASAFVAGAEPAKTGADGTADTTLQGEAEAKNDEATGDREDTTAATSRRSRSTKQTSAKAQPAPKRSLSSKASSTQNAKRATASVASKSKADASESNEPAPAPSSAAPAGSSVNEAAAAALANSAKLASSCRPRGGPSGAGKARIIYSQDGEVQSVEILTAKFRDTLTGSCVRMVFRRAKIPPFKGEPPTFIKSFTIPEE